MQNRIQHFVTGYKLQLRNENHHWIDKFTPVELNYKVIKGNSSLPPVIICHGMLGSHQNWSVIGRKINQQTDRSVYLPDMRNHGSSPHSNGMTYYDMASDVNNFIRKRDLGEVILMGKKTFEVLCKLLEKQKFNMCLLRKKSGQIVFISYFRA